MELFGAHHILHVSSIRVKVIICACKTLRLTVITFVTEASFKEQYLPASDGKGKDILHRPRGFQEVESPRFQDT